MFSFFAGEGSGDPRGISYNFEAAIHRQMTRDRYYELRGGYLVQDGYVGLSIGDYIEEHTQLAIGADYYVFRGVRENGLPHAIGMNGEVIQDVHLSDEIDWLVSFKFGFNADNVYAFFGTKFLFK